MKILVTGAAGFIGMHVVLRFLDDGHEVAALDNLNDYYDVNLKKARVEHIGCPKQFYFYNIDLADKADLDRLFAEFRPEIVVNLAAQAGVRYSLENPQSYINSNLVGFTNVLEACRHYQVGHLVYASSSSVYGLNEDMPFDENQNVDHPLALYGATKKANELLAHSYSHLFSLPTTGLRFFTVYGPWGRPDMAPMLFSDAIVTGKPINIFNNGQMKRDFTYIDDVVEGVVRVALKPAETDQSFDPVRPDGGTSNCPWRVFNIGNGHPTPLMDFITELEQALNLTAEKNFMEMQPGDVVETFADCGRLEDWVGFRPKTALKTGVRQFVDWYQRYSHFGRF